MLDHVFTDAIGALRDALESAMLERQAFEERFQADVLLGDLTFETSYGLPGEGLPPRVRTDVTLDWPTWSQTAYRLWYIDNEFDEPPRIEIELVLRIQRLDKEPDLREILPVLPPEGPEVGRDRLERAAPTSETIWDRDLEVAEYAVEISYEGTYELSEQSLNDGSEIDKDFGALGGWIASMLVRLGDLPLTYRPAEELDDD